MKKLHWLLCIALMCGTWGAAGQNTASAPYQRPSFKRLDLLPAISYAPETKLTMGVIGFYYLDLYKSDPNTHLSNINFLAIYTTAKQVSIQGTWDIFTDGDRWRFRGESFFDIYPDRDYGLGNNADALVVEWDEKDHADTLNYLRFNSNRLHFSPVVLRRISPTIYLGLQGNMEYLFDYKVQPERYAYLNADSSDILDLPVEGIFSGVGVQAVYDNRANVINPIRGAFVQLGTTHYGKLFGSDFSFHSIRLDARQYLNPVANQTFALREVVNFRFTDDAIPLRALSRVGGRDFIRGYFKGTYQDQHMLAFEAEYRLPLWVEGEPSKFWQIWKRAGLVGFIGGAQVFDNFDQVRFDRFNLAAGGGLRLLLNRESRANIRIDYAIGLNPDSDGPGKRQTGFYFYLGEAF